MLFRSQRTSVSSTAHLSQTVSTSQQLLPNTLRTRDWDGNELLLSDILGTDEDVIYKDLETEVEISLLKKAMLSLNERERQIIELRFGVNRVENKELTQKEVADILGISQSYISRLEKKIMARLKKEIQKMA